MQLQIFTHLSIIFTIPWPPEFNQFMNFPGFKIFNIDLASVLGMFNPCTLHSPFLQRFIFHICLMPVLLAMLLFLACLYEILRTKCAKKGQKRIVKEAIHQTVIRMANIIVFLMYPGLSVKIFSIFKCVEVDQGIYYLSSDMSVECFTDNWRIYMYIAVVC